MGCVEVSLLMACGVYVAACGVPPVGRRVEPGVEASARSASARDDARLTLVALMRLDRAVLAYDRLNHRHRRELLNDREEEGMRVEEGHEEAEDEAEADKEAVLCELEGRVRAELLGAHLPSIPCDRIHRDIHEIARKPSDHVPIRRVEDDLRRLAAAVEGEPAAVDQRAALSVLFERGFVRLLEEPAIEGAGAELTLVTRSI